MNELTIVDDPGAISALLKSSDVSMAFLPSRHHELSQRLGFDISEIARVAQYIPLFLTGQDHLESRKRLAILISAGAERARRVLAERLPELQAQLLTPGRHNVMDEFICPLVDDLMSAMVGAKVALAPDTMITRIFSPSIGVAKRRRLNSELGSVFTQIKAQLTEPAEVDICDRMVLCILGTDALRGTLGCSLHQIFQQLDCQVADELNAVAPPRTGVSYVDRAVETSTKINGKCHERGDMFRVLLKNFETYETQEARNRFFGQGAHTCLGRKISLEIWTAIMAQLNKTPRKVGVLEFGMSRNDVFAVPDKFIIEVSV